MKAMGYSTFGAAADVLHCQAVEAQAPGAGEVRVALMYSGANPSDVKARAGTRPGVTKPAFDVIVPHSDGAGVIDAVGPDVDPARLGTRVWIWNGQWQRAFGTAAQSITLPQDQGVVLPDDVSLEHGACLGIPGLTAAHTVFGSGDVAGQTLLISGAGGAVGHNAVQLAVWGGARVIATCSARDKQRVGAAGADHVLDYRDPELATRILELTQGRGVDRAIEVEFGANVALLADVVRANGTIAAYGSALNMAPVFPFGPFLFKAITIDIVLIYLLEANARAAAISKLHQALTQGALRPEIHAVFDLDDCAKAHETIEAGSRAGAVLLKI